MSDEQVSPLSQIWTRSMNDAEFRARLLANPRTTLEDEMGLMLPENMNVSVIENTHRKYTIVLPVAADLDADDGESDRTVGMGVLMYHIPEHNFAADVRLEGIEGKPGRPGFGANPHGRTGENPGSAAPGGR
jgi:hypothetical protein